MPKFKVQGTGKDSGNSRTRIYTAKDESAAREMAEADVTVIGEIEELPPEPPTERQLAYAQELGIKIPGDATKDELSDLISCKVDEDSKASPQLFTIANGYGVETTRYTREDDVYARIFSALSTPGCEQELAAWFAFNVLKDRSSSRSADVPDSPNEPRLNSLASKLVADPKVMQSIKRYSESGLLWFGERTDSEGYTRQGGSIRTAAYKAAAALVDAEFGLKTSTAATSEKTSRSPSPLKVDATDKKSGPSIATIVIIGIIVLIALVAML
ncbi:MAG: hypothetical protein ACQEXG_18145 [Pseudomonadota bacterium]